MGKGAVVAAGAVVTEDAAAGAVVAGCPARVIKMKDEKTEAKTALVDALHAVEERFPGGSPRLCPVTLRRQGRYPAFFDWLGPANRSESAGSFLLEKFDRLGVPKLIFAG